MKASLFASAGILVLLAASPAQQAKKAESADNADQSRIVVDVQRVNLLFTVADKKGRFVTDLKREDFEVIENKKQQNILEFTAESNLPLRLAILIDTSNSIRERFRFEQEAAVEFINSLMRPEDKAVVVSFDTAAELVPTSPATPKPWARPFATCGPAAARRSTTPCSSPRATS